MRFGLEIIWLLPIVDAEPFSNLDKKEINREMGYVICNVDMRYHENSFDELANCSKIPHDPDVDASRGQNKPSWATRHIKLSGQYQCNPTWITQLANHFLNCKSKSPTRILIKGAFHEWHFCRKWILFEKNAHHYIVRTQHILYCDRGQDMFYTSPYDMGKMVIPCFVFVTIYIFGIWGVYFLFVYVQYWSIVLGMALLAQA